MKVYIQNLWYSFIRDNSFLQTPSKSLPGKQENHSPVPLGTSRTASMCIFPSILNCSQANRKNSITDESTQMGFKNLFFFTIKVIKTGQLLMKFSSTSNTSVQRCLYPLFQNKRPHLLLLPIFRKKSSPSGHDKQNGTHILSMVRTY